MSYVAAHSDYSLREQCCRSIVENRTCVNFRVPGKPAEQEKKRGACRNNAKRKSPCGLAICVDELYSASFFLQLDSSYETNIESRAIYVTKTLAKSM